MTTWYLYQDETGRLWWSEQAPVYAPQGHRMLASQQSDTMPTDTSLHQSRG